MTLDDPTLFTVAVCTRNRPAHLEETLAAVDRLDGGTVPVVVVDQSDDVDPQLAQRQASHRLDVVRDSGRGLSRARNLAWRQANSEWVAFLDDDCRPERDWAVELRRAIAAHPDVGLVSGEIVQGEYSAEDYLPVSILHVPREQRLHGRWTLPWKVGIGACTVVRRDVLVGLGGFDERLGAGVPDFPASEDMDFNYRFTRSGGTALLTPRVRSVHDQWREAADLAGHFDAYMTGWTGFAVKQIRCGDVAGGIWLWFWGAWDVARLFASAARRRSPFRLKIAVRKLRALVTATRRALRRSW